MCAAEKIGIIGWGVVTDGVAHVGELGATARFEVLDPVLVAQHDVLVQLSIRAVHQAWTMADGGVMDGERAGMIFVSAWGTVDATVGFLESMLDADGKYASPRHFSRSVYSSVASAAAIHFGIKGICETLAFKPAAMGRGGDVVQGAMRQAWRMLAVRRVDRVVVVWADQAAEISADLARRAARELGRKEYARFEEGLGFGAVAVVAGRAGEGGIDLALKDCRESPAQGEGGSSRPWAMDGALGFLQRALKS